MAGLSLVLMLYAPFEWWSLFVNVLTWPLIGAMFVVEWVVRRLGFKELPSHTPLCIATKILAYQRQVGTDADEAARTDDERVVDRPSRARARELLCVRERQSTPGSSLPTPWRWRSSCRPRSMC